MPASFFLKSKPKTPTVCFHKHLYKYFIRCSHQTMKTGSSVTKDNPTNSDGKTEGSAKGRARSRFGERVVKMNLGSEIQVISVTCVSLVATANVFEKQAVTET
jgi:hypothetical protein